MNYKIVKLKGKDPVLVRYNYNPETDKDQVTIETVTSVMDGVERIDDWFHYETIIFENSYSAKLFVEEVSDKFIEQFLSRISI